MVRRNQVSMRMLRFVGLAICAVLSVVILLSHIIVPSPNAPHLSQRTATAVPPFGSPTATTMPTALPAPTNQVSIALDGPTGPSQLALSTNEEDCQDIADATTPRGAIVLNTLQSWNPPMVRLHMGFRGSTFLRCPK